MIELKINEQVVDVMEETVISYNYDLYGEVLSNFTTSYTNSIDLPMTPRNKGVFGYPNVTYGSLDHANDTFELYRDGILVDSGVVVVDHITDDVISVNLFGELIAKGEELGKIENFGECCKSDHVFVPYYDIDTGEWTTRSKVIAHEINKNISSLVLGTTDDVLYYKDTQNLNTKGYLYLATANIGKPKALNCDSYYDANASPKIKQWPEGGERTFLQTLSDDEWDSYAIQTRFYDLQPVMPVDVFFLNLFRGKGITISQGVHWLLNGVYGAYDYFRELYITLPSLRDFLEGQTYENTTVSPSSSTLSSTVFSGVYPVESRLKLSGLLNHDLDNWGTLSGKTKMIAIQMLTITAQHGSDTPVVRKYLVYTDDSWKYVKGSLNPLVHQWYKDDSVAKINRRELAYTDFIVDGLTDGITYNVTVTCNGVYQRGYSYYDQYNGQVYVYKNNGSWTHDWNELGGKCTTSGEKSTFTLLDYFKGIKEPWKLAVDICKQFNLRFKFTSPSTMELVLGGDFRASNSTMYLRGEYYEVPSSEEEALNIDKYLDWSDFKIVPQVFENKTVTFTPEFNDTSWDVYVEKNYVYPYGTKVCTTNYPVKSEEEWFEWNTLKHLSTFSTWKFVLPIIPGHTTESSERISYITSQAFDENDVQVSIPYSLCCKRATTYWGVSGFHPTTYICNEMQSSDFCYYGQDYLMDHLIGDNDAIAVDHMPFVSTIDWDKDLFLFGDRVVPSGVGVKLLQHNGFGDVVDQMQSSKLVLKVFLDKMNVKLYDFIREMYLIDSSVYIVGAVHNYAIGTGESCEVEFIKVIDMKNYKVEEEPTVE